MRPLNLVVLILTFSIASSCAGKKVPLSVRECISDGITGFYCNDGFISFADSRGWITHDPVTDELIWDTCRIQKVGK
jgi:hypothetical protein